MKKSFEESFLDMVLADTRKIFKDENSITKNYYNCYIYLNEIIDNVRDNASLWLLTKLYILSGHYQYRYLYHKGLL